MSTDIYNEVPAFRSRLSFLPLVRAWRQIAASGDDLMSGICAGLAERYAIHPELLECIDDYKILENHRQLIGETAATLFPVSLHAKDQLDAIATPFSNKLIYASSFFRHSFMDEKNNYVLPLDAQVENNISKARINLAYKLILEKFFGSKIKGGDSFICAYPESKQDIHNYFELTWNSQFIDVTACEKLPALPAELLSRCHHVDDLENFPGLSLLLPLSQFIFDGILVISIREVTAREAVNAMRTIFQNENVLENIQLFNAFKEQARYLLGNEKMDVGITSFQTNDFGNFSIPQHASAFLKNIKTGTERKEATDFLLNKLEKDYYYLVRSSEKNMPAVFYEQLKSSGWTTILFLRAATNNKVIGCLEICSNEAQFSEHLVLTRLQPVMPLIQMVLQKNFIHLQNEVNRLVKDHFTAVHSSVEWKFNETAINYLLKIEQGETPKMDSIVFNEVYPLYGLIDIRNSSMERNRAAQQDILKQLQWVKLIFMQAQDHLSFPLLEELQSQLDAYMLSVTNFLFASDEQAIYSFLRTEVSEMLHHLTEMIPSVSNEIHNYFEALDKPLLTLNVDQKQFEESVNTINDSISDFLEKEQPDAQAIYPHYFERFVTDGVEFNIYIGQSLAPAKKFNPLYLKNLRLWQLKVLAQAALHLKQAMLHLPVKMETTQLILVYSNPISIRFRTAERKFDVDGVYHARYEVIKKRIDKALIKNTNERLTKPGTIAIVYYHEKEAQEYLQYINFLSKQKLLSGAIERLELEDLQGVTGLKALRVEISMQETEQEAKQEMSKKKSSP